MQSSFDLGNTPALAPWIGKVNAVVGDHGVDFVRNGFDKTSEEIRSNARSGFLKAVAERMEGISHPKVAHGVQASPPCLTDPFASDRESPFMKAACGKTARTV
jgi:hypothetical protein